MYKYNLVSKGNKLFRNSTNFLPIYVYIEENIIIHVILIQIFKKK
jgi:hypothetical protein